jgi:7,8-dihydro-6-hydroxymethylpterin-pyrophosphokinase
LLDLVEEFRAVVAALEAAEVQFAVCGGLAVAIHAQPRATMDVDLLLPNDQIVTARYYLPHPEIQSGEWTLPEIELLEE